MIKALEIRTSKLFNLVFANNTILSYFFFFFLRINLYFLIPAVIVQIFNPTAEFVISIGRQIKEAKTEIETHVVTAKAKISVQYTLMSYTIFASYSSIHFDLFHQ